jgi:hypothetical protein
VTETVKQVLADKGKDAIEKGIKGVIGDKEKKATTAAPETKITNPVTATVNEAPPAPAPKKHRSLNPLHWGWKNKDKDKEKHKDDGTALTAKK